MPTYRVHVVFTLPADEEQDAVAEVNDLLEEADAASGGDIDWDITEVWDYDEWEDKEDEELVIDEW